MRLAGAEVKRAEGDKRLDGANPFGDSLFTTRNWGIVEELKRVGCGGGGRALPVWRWRGSADGPGLRRR